MISARLLLSDGRRRGAPRSTVARPRSHDRRSRGCCWCSPAAGEPSIRELKNRRELEALLTAISLKNKKELDKDIQRIEDRHASGELSDAGLQDLQEIIKKAQAGDWAGAEKQAYELPRVEAVFQVNRRRPRPM